MRAYEGMFLFDPAVAVEWSNVEAEVNRLISRAEGQLIACKRWDERRLAYEIRGRKRACYVLTFFRAPSDKIAGLERDVQLSENILRCLVLKADHLTEDEMKAAAEKAPEPPSEDRGDRGGRWRGRDDDFGRPHGGRDFGRPDDRVREAPPDAVADVEGPAEWTGDAEGVESPDKP